MYDPKKEETVRKGARSTRLSGSIASVFAGFPTRGRIGLAGLLCVALIAAACTLDVAGPVSPPPENWDPVLNTHPRGETFQKILDDYVRKGLPGVVLFVKTPEGLWNGAAGYACIETGERMTPTHRFHGASVTKMYTATAVMLLVEDGLLELDAPIRKYLPEDVWRRIPNGDQATVRQLLSHRSGIPDFKGDLRYDLDFLNNPFGELSTERLLGYLYGQSPWAAPGERYFYSNANYVLLAMIVDAVVPSGHAAVISQRILQPLGLTATYYRNEAEFPTPPGLVNTYQDLAGDGRLVNVTDLTTQGATVLFGNAGLIATSSDYATFLDALMEGKIVSPASLATMMEKPTETSTYGLGLSFTHTDYGEAVGHSGGELGAVSQVRYFPERDATLVLLSNGGDGGLPARLFRDLFHEAMAVALGG